MNRRRWKLLGGSAVAMAALFYLVYGGMREAVVYFQTPSEIKSNPQSAQGKSVRIGGQVVPGSLRVDKASLRYAFEVTDGVERIRVRFQGIPPDLFREGQGAVIEGKVAADGSLVASTIFAKHAEEYSPPETGKPPSPRSFVPVREDAER